ncbi:5-hydroxytryptamine receptor 1A-alpha [Holothuria leucospilota]|uniref:5-hydroxytryptamine receptor 1A-alpha n=1 Tax=Holothuria leucospilota TaxID=206669 RepID=A0A9Q1CGA6_HOLLE|nr:5-hydroxytryptamine receptor 1A-alpha [Holothuria leucospilota]
MHGNGTVREYIYIPVEVQVIYLVLGIAILVVNLIVMVAYTQDRDIRRVPANVYILNLSISDFITGVHLLIRFFWAVASGAVVPVYESVPCLFLGVFHHASLVMSSLIVMEISFDRLKMVSNPFKYRQRTVRRAVIVSVCTWIAPVIYISLLVHVVPIVADLFRIEYKAAVCLETQLPRVFIVLSFWGDCVIPFIILLVLNGLVILRLRKATLERFQRQKSEYNFKSSRRNISASETSSHSNWNRDTIYTLSDGKENAQQNNAISLNTYIRDDEERRHGNGFSSNQSATETRIKEATKKEFRPAGARINEATKREFKKIYRTAAILRVFVGVYFICWMPFYVTLAISKYHSIPEWVILLASVNVSLNSFINPFMYAYMSRKFRRRFLLMLKCRRR